MFCGQIPPKPIPEQELARHLFLKEEGLRIDAYAGTGKTTTLQLLAESSKNRGLYLAFNRSIAMDAQSRFPQRVICATSHSIAFRGILRQHGLSEWKLTGSLNANMILASFTMPETLTFRSGLTLSDRSYCSVLLDALKRYLQSDEDEPKRRHFAPAGCLAVLTDAQFADFTSQAIGHVHSIWAAMRDKTAALPLGHDGYLKLWALSRPRSQVDYIMVDEAQDLNPVILGVLSRMKCPVIYVGDPYQQIYEWRGAVNAMDLVTSKHQVLLSQSFRFGDAIANAATAVTRRLGAKRPLRGLPGLVSHLARVKPDVILARSNSGVIGSVLKCLGQGVSCHVLGGTRELERVLEDVRRVKQGAAAQSPELLGFAAWKDVMAFSGQVEGEYLRGLVRLVQEHGEETMLRAVARCEKEESLARVTCSTAHKAKGREWKHVRVDADFDSALLRASKGTRERGTNTAQSSSFEAEARLLYVAMTRAKTAVDLPRGVRLRFDLQTTTSEILGGETVSKGTPDSFPGKTDAIQAEVVSPYHSPGPSESREMRALRKFLG
jgi:superfamily I DNA/RNA helicase